MKRAALAAFISCLGFAQSEDSQAKFEIADVHISPKSQNDFMRSTPVRGTRYEIHNASMVDLIRVAYGYDADKVLGGPNWLEMDRFEVIAKLPPKTNAETMKPMLQDLLASRFKLVLHKDTQPLPTYVLTAGKKPQMKEAEGSEETGCKIQNSSNPAPPPPGEGGMGIIRMMTMNANGTTTTLTLGPDMIIHYACRNMSMASFTSGLRSMMGASNYVGTNPVQDETGIKGNWNFDLKFSMMLNGPMMQQATRVTLGEAVEKQMGLKLEERPIPTPVLVVDKVERKPTDNPAGVAEALPVIQAPTEFEVATMKLVEGGPQMGPIRSGSQGGRFTSQGMPLRMLVSRAFNVMNFGTNDAIVGLPAWADTERYDINAKEPSRDPDSPPFDNDAISVMLRNLLVDRLKMKYHTEERPLTAYTLVAAKPKMKKADPNSRSHCKNANAPAGSPPGSRLLTCQNVTMAQFADRLQNLTRDLSWPVQDATGLEGGWDISLTFTQGPMMAMPVRVAGPDGGMPGGGGVAMPAAPDPTGGYTIFAAIEKQLGLKLEQQKRNLPVFVIDHIEQKPIEN
jgi:uncharacterized protein (TIGR03435 family)